MTIKITKNRLRQLIREELEEMQSGGSPWIHDQNLPRTIDADAQPSVTATYVKMTFEDGSVEYHRSMGDGKEKAKNALSQGTLRRVGYGEQMVKPVEAKPVQLTFSWSDG